MPGARYFSTNGIRYTGVQCAMSSKKNEPGICGSSDLGRAARGVCESFSQPLDRSAYGLCGVGVLPTARGVGATVTYHRGAIKAAQKHSSDFSTTGRFSRQAPY